MKHTIRIATPLLAAVILFPALPALAAKIETINAPYLYSLSGFSGTLPVSWVRLKVDQSRNEVYMIAGIGVRIFNESGMEVYSFNNNGELGAVTDLAVTEDGDIFVIAYHEDFTQEIVRCNYRGDRKSTVTLQGVPPEFAGLTFNCISYRSGLLYFANTNEMKVVITDLSGAFQKGYDINPLIGNEAKEDSSVAKEEASGINMSGFSVSQQGDILFTIASVARIGVIAPDGGFRMFGQRGSTPGKLGVPAGVAVDASGKFILVADTLRCRIIVFDKTTFQVQGEFGGRISRVDGLVAPFGLAVDGKNRVYVTQGMSRGVNVYQMSAGG